jgi:hypothetical protein
MSESLKKALHVINTIEVTHAGQFAYLMWPDSPAWKSLGRCGPNGSAPGVGIKLAGGAYLGKLQKRGLAVSGGICWRLTDIGKKKLAELS